MIPANGLGKQFENKSTWRMERLDQIEPLLIKRNVMKKPIVVKLVAGSLALG